MAFLVISHILFPETNVLLSSLQAECPRDSSRLSACPVRHCEKARTLSEKTPLHLLRDEGRHLLICPSEAAFRAVLWSVNWVLIERTWLSGFLSADRIFLGAYIVKLFHATNQQCLNLAHSQKPCIFEQRNRSHTGEIFTEPYLIAHQNNTWSLKM